MSGNSRLRQLTIPVILIGFCAYIVYLYISGSITLYIHPRYTVFALCMAIVAAFILLVHILFMCTSKIPRHTHTNKLTATNKLLNGIVLIVLVLGFVVPPKALSPEIIGNRTVQTQNTTAGRNVEAECPPYPAKTIGGLVFDFEYYPAECYEGMPIELVGFVVDSYDSPLPSSFSYLGRVMVSCCAIDAQPYAIPMHVASFEHHDSGTWLRVKGVLREHEIQGQLMFVIEPSSITGISQPDDTYDYL